MIFEIRGFVTPPTVYQSGFRPLHSTETALLNTTDDWLGEFDKGNVVVAVMLDLKGAFDTIDHKILTNKIPPKV